MLSHDINHIKTMKRHQLFTRLRTVAALVLLMLTTATAWADDVAYRDASNAQKTATGVNVLEENSLSMTDGWYVACKPYIVKWETTTPGYIENPVFSAVTISSTSTMDVEGDAACFHGIYNAYSTGGKDNTMLYLGADNKLYYPNADMTIGAFRAYFQLKGINAGAPVNGIRTFVLNFGNNSEASGIKAIENGKLNMENVTEGWYTTDGRKVSSVGADHVPASLPKGLYIHNGHKVVVQ